MESSKIDIICLNLGYNVMANKISGSESSFVKKCQNKYPRYKGWSNSTKQISIATFNAAKLLSEYDLFAVQEVNEKYVDVFFNSITYNQMDKNWKFLLDGYLAVGYDEDFMGIGIPLTKNMRLDSRSIQLIWFEKHKLLFINLHAPHDIDLKKIIQQTCDKIRLNIKPTRIIMCGDFNDYRGTLIDKDIKIFGKILKIPNKSKVKSCCDDSGYKYPGDYFLDSDDKISLYFGLPHNYDRKVNLISDHDPIVLMEY